MDDRDAQALQLLGEEPEAQAHDARRPAEQWLNQETGTIASLPADRILGPDGLGVPPLSGELLGPACSHDPASERGLAAGAPAPRAARRAPGRGVHVPAPALLPRQARLRPPIRGSARAPPRDHADGRPEASGHAGDARRAAWLRARRPRRWQP